MVNSVRMYQWQSCNSIPKDPNKVKLENFKLYLRGQLADKFACQEIQSHFEEYFQLLVDNDENSDVKWFLSRAIYDNPDAHKQCLDLVLKEPVMYIQCVRPLVSTLEEKNAITRKILDQANERPENAVVYFEHFFSIYDSNNLQSFFNDDELYTKFKEWNRQRDGREDLDYLDLLARYLESIKKSQAAFTSDSGNTPENSKSKLWQHFDSVSKSVESEAASSRTAEGAMESGDDIRNIYILGKDFDRRRTSEHKKREDNINATLFPAVENGEEKVSNVLAPKNPTNPKIPGYFKALGYELKAGEAGVYLILPTVETLLSRWEKLREENPALPEIRILSEQGAATPEDFIKCHTTYDLLVSTDEEHVHDQTVHVISTLAIIFSENEKYQSFCQLRKKFIEESLEALEKAKTQNETETAEIRHKIEEIQDQREEHREVYRQLTKAMDDICRTRVEIDVLTLHLGMIVDVTQSGAYSYREEFFFKPYDVWDPEYRGWPEVLMEHLEQKMVAIDRIPQQDLSFSSKLELETLKREYRIYKNNAHRSSVFNNILQRDIENGWKKIVQHKKPKNND